jgi:hypothetical protein
MPAKYDHIDFSPPEGVRNEAAKGLEWRKEHGRGGTEVGVARARDLSNGKSISPETAKRMNSYFARHEVDKQGEGWSPGDDGFPSAGRIAWALWGGDPGKAWAAKLVRQIDAADSKGERMASTAQRAKRRETRCDPSALCMRMLEVRRESANSEQRSVPVVIATENPVERFDYQSNETIREVLLMDGVQMRGVSRQLPIVDSHDPSTVANVLGSVRNVRVEGDSLVGDAMFAADQRSQEAYQKLMDGHLTDFSITATPKERMRVARGSSYQLQSGETVHGPAEIISAWMPTDASLVAIGADERSTARLELQRSYREIPSEDEQMPMDEELMKSLRESGMPDDVDTYEAALRWAVGRMADEEEVENMDQDQKLEQSHRAEDEEERAEDDEKVEHKLTTGQQIQRALKTERARQKEIHAICRSAEMPEMAEQYVESGSSLDAVRADVLKRLADRQVTVGGGSMRFTESESDKLEGALKSAITQRALQNAGVQAAKTYQPVPGSEDFRYMPLIEVARMLLRKAGVQVERFAPRDIAAAAMGNENVLGKLGIRRSDTAYHTTGLFPALMLDAANKTLLAAYEEAPYTWNLWARQAASVPDFKGINRIRFSESPNLEMVPENSPYPEGKMSDSKETYQIEKFGQIFSVSWETVINDDLDAISRIPAMHGNAARRTQNRKVYEVLASNPVMGDGNALFSTEHANGVLSGGTAPTTTSLNAGFLAMMTQKGLNSAVTLNVIPRYVIVPAALSATVLQLLGSLAPVEVGGNAAGNSNVLNLYGPNGPRPLVPVIDPQLDAFSVQRWYLAASNAQIDTVELSFLQGEEAPVIESMYEFDVDTLKYKVRQTFGVKAIDWRGLYTNVGA